jgi:adenylate kinase family enzyme
MASQIARRLVILGAPGSGKGTIASRIVKSYGVPHIVVGDLLRQHIQQKSGNKFLIIKSKTFILFKRKVEQLKNISIKVFYYLMNLY